jgi:hypothetical protein
MATEEEIFQLIYKYLGEDEARKFEAALDRQKTKTDELTAATDKTSKGTANMGRTMLETGRIVQDFAQGGIGGVLNNIEGLVAALGLGSGLAGVLTIVGVGIALLKQPLMDLASSLLESGEKSKNWGTALQQVDRDLKDVTRELDEYTKKQSLSNEEVDKANELSARQIALEKEKKRLEEEKKNVEKLRGLQTPEEEEARKARTEAVTAALGGGAERQATVAALATQMSAEDRERLFGERRILQGQLAAPDLPGVNRLRLQRQLAAVNQQLERSMRGEAFPQFQQRAEALAGGALAGDAGAFNQVLAMMQRGQGFQLGEAGEWTRLQMERGAPAGIAAAHAERQGIEEQRRMGGLDRQLAERRRKEAEQQKKDDADFRKGLQAELKTHVKPGPRALAEAEAPKAKVSTEAELKRQAEAERKEALARQIHGMAGGQFTPDQARHAAGEAIKLQQQQVPVNQAIMGAMQNELMAMAKLRQELMQQHMQFLRMQQGFGNMAQGMGPMGAPMGAQMAGP